MMRIFRLEVLSGSKILAKLPNGRGIKQFFQENLARYGKSLDPFTVNTSLEFFLG